MKDKNKACEKRLTMFFRVTIYNMLAKWCSKVAVDWQSILCYKFV